MKICIPGFVSNIWSRIVFIPAGERLVHRDSNQLFCGGKTFLLREENDRCTGTRGGMSHKLFLLQEDDDLCTGTCFKYLVANHFYTY